MHIESYEISNRSIRERSFDPVSEGEHTTYRPSINSSCRSSRPDPVDCSFNSLPAEANELISASRAYLKVRCYSFRASVGVFPWANST